MAEVNISNVDQILSRIVRSDGRVGGLQSVVGQTVYVVTRGDEDKTYRMDG